MELPDRASAEHKFAASLARTFADYRHQVEPYLQRGEQVPESVWVEIEQDAQEKLAALLMLIFATSAISHGADRPAIEAAAASFADQRSREVASQLVANTRARFTTTDFLAASPATRAEQLVVALGPDRASTIAVTETTVATSAGGEGAATLAGNVSTLDIWYTALDSRVCKICGPLHGALRSEWQRRFPLGPPGHPNCRCYISYEFERN